MKIALILFVVTLALALLGATGLCVYFVFIGYPVALFGVLCGFLIVAEFLIVLHLADYPRLR